ncbi:RSP_7527 family protein [Pelagibius sp.]|uniref:RSP_7527 family protein n=1 Tax=Pelagibius sp. TaxID=1931238 RepID=UPI002609D5B6|nr:hypothetical protein [Pelagibius sp.]
MKHQSQDQDLTSNSRPLGAADDGDGRIEFTIDPAQVDRYIAEAQRMRAAAIRAFFKSLFSRRPSAPKAAESSAGPAPAAGNRPLHA